METLKYWDALHRYVMFMCLTTVSKGSACEAPSSPECFRKNVTASVYMCDWTMNTTDSKVKFDIYFNNTKFVNVNQTKKFHEELLTTNKAVHVWLEAHAENSSCSSPRRSVELRNLVKYDAPQNISVSWINNNLNLTWKAAAEHPALAEVWVRRDGQPLDKREKRLTITTTYRSKRQRATVANLLKDSVYHVQIRHLSTQVKNPLWSKWSPVVTVPAELEHKPEVSVTTKNTNGTREVTLTWKPMPRAASRVTYRLEVTQSHGCPCARKEGRRHFTETNNYTVYVTYADINISVIAVNAAGSSPPAIIRMPAEQPTSFKTCDKRGEAISRKKTCKQWYQFQNHVPRLENVLTSKGRGTDRRVEARLKDHVRYLYFEHICDDGKPRTVKMCLYYKKEGVPRTEPRDFTASNETHNSANLSWKEIAPVDQQGFLTHYSLCIVNVGAKDELTECHNVSASLKNYHLQNLTPGAKYNISLAGVTQVGEGPKAGLSINTLQGQNVNVWLSFGLLFVFFLSSTMCTVVLKRIQRKILPPVPTPVIQDFSRGQPEGQEMLEGKEEVHELMLFQRRPDVESVPGDVEETTAQRGEWDVGRERDMVNDRANSGTSGITSDESPGSLNKALRSAKEAEITDLEQVENEIAMLIYRNGLVFDMKTDLP